jgi:ubiquinone/menaquinone biosynthesis C-methylase UbiE
MPASLNDLHENVPPDYYDVGIQKNFFQRLWHQNRFRHFHSFTSKPNGRILDIGCHSGLFTQEILKQNKAVEVYGIDISEPAIAYAKKRIKKGHFFSGDAHYLPFKANFFDAVYCLEMLEHVEHPEQVLSEMKRVLKKNGFGIILIPIDSRLFNLLWSLWNANSGVWKHTHIQSFNEKSLTRLLTKAGLKITKSRKTHRNMLLLIEFRK